MSRALFDLSQEYPIAGTVNSDSTFSMTSSLNGTTVNIEGSVLGNDILGIVTTSELISRAIEDPASQGTMNGIEGAADPYLGRYGLAGYDGVLKYYNPDDNSYIGEVVLEDIAIFGNLVQ